MDCNDWLLVGWVDSLKGLALLALHPFAIDIQARRLFVGDGRSLDLRGERHDCEWLSVQRRKGRYERYSKMVSIIDYKEVLKNNGRVEGERVHFNAIVAKDSGVKSTTAVA
jgi:hypothetical protein